jgi:PBP1b-binding outer membrane lipoprotein LpoB
MLNKFFKSVLSLMAIAMVMVSCDKEDAKDVFTDNHENTVLQEPPITQFPDLRVFFDYGGDNFGCEGIHGNCLPDVSMGDIGYQQVIDKVVDIAANQRYTDISRYFQNNRDLISRIIDKDIVDLTIAENLFVTVKQNKMSNIDYLFFNVSNEDRVMIIYPFKRSK